jgi:hypothetical protein
LTASAELPILMAFTALRDYRNYEGDDFGMRKVETLTSVATYLEALVRESQKPEAEVIALAFQAGLKQLWREHILGRYLRGEISREEAVEAVGIDWVEIAERQKKAIMEDLTWALG